MSPTAHCIRRVAYARVLLPDGTSLLRQVVAFDAQGVPTALEPLTVELPFTEWRNEVYVWPPACAVPKS